MPTLTVSLLPSSTAARGAVEGEGALADHVAVAGLGADEVVAHRQGRDGGQSCSGLC